MLTTKTAGAFISNAPGGETMREKMQQVEITRGTVAQGQPRAVGDTLELPEREAQYLIKLKKAVPLGDRAPAPDNREADMEAKTSTRAKKR
jgi:hypothetical protein